MTERYLPRGTTMNSARKRPPAGIPAHWRKSRPLSWRLRSLINQRKRGRG
jgi:hypothetical protein